MNDKLSAEAFFDQYDREHPFPKDCSMGVWLDAMIEAQKAYEKYDPAGAADLRKDWPVGVLRSP